MKRYGKLLVAALLILPILYVGLNRWQEKPSQNSIQNPPSEESSSAQPASNSGQDSFIESLRIREYKPSPITIESTVSNNNIYTDYIFSYLSDGLKIYGRMNVPAGQGPFPVIVLNHGYYNPSSFQSGDGTNTIAEILARQGYLTIASDYRGHGKSESDGQRGGHRPEYSIDVLSLLASIKNIEKADSSKIGMWGHSMGGEVSLRAIEATDAVKALVLWAPTLGGHSADPVLMDNLKYINSFISLHQGLLDIEVDPKTSVILSDALKKGRNTT